MRSLTPSNAPTVNHLSGPTRRMKTLQGTFRREAAESRRVTAKRGREVRVRNESVKGEG
jgi:hypothetical protein